MAAPAQEAFVADMTGREMRGRGYGLYTLARSGGVKLKSIRLHGVNDLRLHEEPAPEVEPDQVRLRVTAVGVCGSDLHWFTEGAIGDAQLVRPLILGHEFAGIAESGPMRGQRVAVDPAIPCYQCEFCREGNPNLCTALRFAGHGSTDGALREYMTWPADLIHPLPQSLTDADGAMLEPLGVAIHAVDLGHLRPGLTVGVLGCGPIGLLLIQVARVSGAARVIAADLPAAVARLEAARAFGAEVFPARPGRSDGPGEEAQDMLAATGGRGLDVVFEAAGENPAVETALAAVKNGGTVVLAGIPADDRLSFRASTARRKGLTIKLVRRMKHTYPRAIRMVERGQVDVRTLVTARYALEQSAEAFLAANRREGIKVLIEP